MGSTKFDFDFIVLGSGAAGSAAALAFAEAGKKVALVEPNKWGGSSLNDRDIPYHASLGFAHLFTEATQGSRFGLSSKNLRYNYPTALNWQAVATKRSGANNKKVFENAGIACFHSVAHFLSPYEISVGNRRISAPKFLIATGSVPSVRGITGVEQVKCLDPNSAIKVNRPPKAVFVVGGGATGCEIAQYFAELGSKVLIAETSARLLPKEDEEVGQVLGQYFDERLRIKVLTQSRVVGVEQDSVSKKVIFLRGGVEKSVRVDTIVMATGNTPVTDLGLGNTGVKVSRSSAIKTNEYLQTAIKHIYAAGDCLGGANSSTERAAYEGAIAASNMLGRNKNLVNYDGFVRLVDTLPQIAIVGATEENCLKSGRKYKKIVVPLSDISAANTSDFRVGFIKMISDLQGHILGATVMCPHAELVIQELAIAVRHKFTVVEIASTPHVATSWGELVRQAARKLVNKK